MRQRACIFGELRRAQRAHVLDPLDRRRSLVGREALVAEHGEAFLEAQLEPVAASHAIARPVMEIFVRDDRGDRVVIRIGRSVGIGQDVAAVEDVQPLVLHRAEVEVVDRDDVEHVEIIFAAIDALVPRHRDLERGQRMLGLGQVAVAHPDAELHLAARHRREARAVGGQVAGDQREQVARLGVGIAPFGPVLAVGQVARRDRIAISQQHRKALLVGGHLDRIARQHVGTIGEEGDAAEPFRFALRAQIAARRIESHQLRIAVGVDGDLGLDAMFAARQVDLERVAVHPPVVVRHAIDQHRERHLPVAVEPQRPIVRARPGDVEHGGHARRRRVEVEVEGNVGDKPIGRLIILASRDGRCGEGGLGVDHSCSIMRRALLSH